MLWPQTRTLKHRAVKTKQGQSLQNIQGLRLRQLLQSLIISSTRQSRLLPHHQRNKEGKGEGSGKWRGKERRGALPQPAAGSFLVRGKASNEGPSMPLSWRCQPGSPAELRAAHLCPQLAHRSSIKACACCQRQRPQGRPLQQWEEAKALCQALASAPCLLVRGEPSPHLSPSPISQLRADAVTPGDALMKMADINLFPLPTGQFIVPWGALAPSQRA